MHRVKQLLPLILLFVLSFLAVLPVAPHLQPLPLTDSSVFLHIGDQMRHGAVPYRDIWDHKGPLIYFIQFIGLSVSGGSRWGVWALELLFVFLAALAGYSFLSRSFGKWSALVGAVCFLLYLPAVLDGGNLTEEYALFFQFAFLLTLAHGFETRRRRYFYLAGLVSACLFLLRPNAIALPLAAGALLLGGYWRSREPELWKNLLTFFAGGMSLLAIVFLYFAINQALPQMLDAVFRFNFIYSHATISEQAYVMRMALRYLSTFGILAIAGWVLGLHALGTYSQFNVALFSLLLLVAALPLEVALSSMSGRLYPHYYMSLMPVSTGLIAFFVFRASTLNLRASEARRSSSGPKLLSISLLIGLLLHFGWSFRHPLETTVKEIAASGFPRVIFTGSSILPTLQYLETHIAADKPLLVWGNNLRLNWLSGRVAPTRFVYQSAFFEPNYVTPEMVEEIVDALATHPDTVIIDTTSEDSPFLSLAKNIADIPVVLRPLYFYVKTNYVPALKMERTNWQMYLPIEE